jgi:nicotinamide-nucleotide amidase
VEEEARRLLGEIVWGADEDTLAGVIGVLLNERGLTVATMESATGGLLASTMTDEDGSGAWFKGGYVAYTAALKMSLGVSADLIEQHGVISSEVACDMARAARDNLAADFGIGVTGIADVDEIEGKPPGTMHIAVHDGTQAQPVSYTFFQGREATKRRAVTTALLLLRRGLLAR